MLNMPWDNFTAPNLTIEVTDACNIHCRACYKLRTDRHRSLERIQRDLKDAERLRPLHTVTISGGEPTLHPKLYDVVRMVHARGHHTFLLTNGVLVDQEKLRRLRSAGLDSILFHVDPGQERPDLGSGTIWQGVRARLDQLVAMAETEGLDISLSAMLCEGEGELLRAYTEYFLQSSRVTFMFLSRPVDLEALHAGVGAENPAEPQLDRVTEFYRDEYGFEPFAIIPDATGGGTSWVSFFIPAIYGGSTPVFYSYRSNILDSWTMEIPRMFTGRYIHKTSQNPHLTLLRTVLNALSSIRPLKLGGFIRTLFKPHRRLKHKMIVYDDGPRISAEGEIVRCEYCPTAIVRNGRVLPCCSADYGSKSGGR